MLEIQDQIAYNSSWTINEVGTRMFSNVFFRSIKNDSQFSVCPDSFLDAQFSKTLQKAMTAQIKLPTGGAKIKYKQFLVTFLQPRIKNFNGIILLDEMPCILKIICEVCESSLSAIVPKLSDSLAFITP